MVELIFDLGLYSVSSFCLMWKYFLLNEVVSNTEASTFSQMETRSFWLVFQMKQKLLLICSLNICIKIQWNAISETDEKKTCELTTFLPPSGRTVHYFNSHRLSLQEAASIMGMSHSLTQTLVPVAGTRGFQSHSWPEGLYFSTGLL